MGKWAYLLIWGQGRIKMGTGTYLLIEMGKGAYLEGDRGVLEWGKGRIY